MTELTAHQRTIVTQAMKNARRHIEAEQGEPLDLDQITTIDSLCEAMGIDPNAVLGKAAGLIDAPFEALTVEEAMVLQ